MIKLQGEFSKFKTTAKVTFSKNYGKYKKGEVALMNESVAKIVADHKSGSYELVDFSKIDEIVKQVDEKNSKIK